MIKSKLKIHAAPATKALWHESIATVTDAHRFHVTSAKHFIWTQTNMFPLDAA